MMGFFVWGGAHIGMGALGAGIRSASRNEAGNAPESRIGVDCESWFKDGFEFVSVPGTITFFTEFSSRHKEIE